jgi:hypothetical protein
VVALILAACALVVLKLGLARRETIPPLSDMFKHALGVE